MPSTRKYIVELASRGRYHFTTAEAQAALGRSRTAVRAALRRLARLGDIAAPLRGYYVIVPPEYRSLGCLPPEQLVPHLMDHLGLHYYAALLSAAELHGAAHHRPQQFQVMVASNRRPVACGKVRVLFTARRDLAKTPTVDMNTPRGRLRVASAEATALELVGYAHRCGGLDMVATALSELVESVKAPRLLAAARLCPVAWVQRLGYLLEVTGHHDAAAVLVDHVAGHAPAIAPLVRAKPFTAAPRAPRWKLALNASVEPDL